MLFFQEAVRGFAPSQSGLKSGEEKYSTKLQYMRMDRKYSDDGLLQPVNCVVWDKRPEGSGDMYFFFN